ncbi:MAG: prepilin-type N-terminal cleavage/methylation domain-containing protein [Puniceicoccales bacterium]|nr:prepilin-type N-terminal cleavage/methylation domain-containing protein [Puniceicoccales bacterium]
MQKCRSAEVQKCRSAEVQKCRSAEVQKCRSAEKGKSKSKSFTLVEIVFTISIIGILLAILLPAMSAIKLSAQKVRDVSNLKKIAEAWRECVVNRGRKIDSLDWWGRPGYVSLVMERLAGCDAPNSGPSDMILNDLHTYISSGDKYAAKVTKDMICFFNGTYVHEAGWITGVSNFMMNGTGFLMSYCLVAGLSGNVPLDTTPFAFTRGLCADGTWDEKAGLYGSKGGYVIYCDGHVTWFDGSRPAKFLKWDQSGYTTDIRGAVPSSTWITCGDREVNANYMNSNNQLVILSSAGTGG